MSITMISGARDTGDVLAGSKKVDMGDTSQLEDDKIMLMKLVSQVAKKSTYNSTFNWLTDELNSKFDTLAEDLDNSETAVDVTNGGYFRAGDVVRVAETGELMRVSSVTTNTLTVERGWGSTSGTAAANGGQLIILGPAYAEGATLEAARTTTEVLQTDYTQIFRHPFHLTGTIEAMGKGGGLHTGDAAVVQRTKKLIEHCRDINLSFYWGVKNSFTGNIRTTGGINEYIPAENRDSVTALTEAEWNDGLRAAFRYGSGKRVAFVSRKIAGIINEYMSNVQRVAPGDSKYGVKMVDYISPHGEVSIVTDHALEGTEGDKYAFVLDMADSLKYRFLNGRDTTLLTDRQTPDEDAIREEYLTECGFEKGEGRRHYVFTSVTS